MSQDVVLQADLGELSIRGLSAFGPLLAALSADNVDSVAVIQLEHMGSLFHTNGKYAEQVPELLKRCSSSRLDRLGIIVGWKKGDSASFMAQTAGGQSAALLCFCLMNIYKIEDAGAILYDLSEKALPYEWNLASIQQLAAFAHLLASKLFRLGFGNILAKQIDRILQVYHHLQKPIPTNFFDPMTRDGTVHLLYSISAALRNEEQLVRITGTQAIGHIASMVLIMFPADVTIIVEGFVIQQGVRRSIVIESTDDASHGGPTCIQVERYIKDLQSESIPIEIEQNQTRSQLSTYTFLWQGHVSASLKLKFISVGLECSTELLAACADLVLLLAASIKRYDPVGKYDNPLPSNGLLGLLGSEPIQRLYKICNTVLETIPSGGFVNLADAYMNLLTTFSQLVDSAHRCTCPGSITCDFSSGWSTVVDSSERCIPSLLWRNVGNAMYHTLVCSLVDAEENVAIHYNGNRSYYLGLHNLEKIFRGYSPRTVDRRVFWNCSDLHLEVMFLTKGTLHSSRPPLMLSTNSSTIYPRALARLQVDPDIGFLYELRDGNIVEKNRYHQLILSGRGKTRVKAEQSLDRQNETITPSSAGVHSNISFTVRELIDSLEIRTDLEAEGQVVNLDLTQTIVSAMGLEDANTCEHNPRRPITLIPDMDVITTSVITPIAQAAKIAIAQTEANRLSQMLACSEGTNALLQRSCCLECAVMQAKNRSYSQVIVGI